MNPAHVKSHLIFYLKKDGFCPAPMSQLSRQKSHKTKRRENYALSKKKDILSLYTTLVEIEATEV